MVVNVMGGGKRGVKITNAPFILKRERILNISLRTRTS